MNRYDALKAQAHGQEYARSIGRFHRSYVRAAIAARNAQAIQEQAVRLEVARERLRIALIVQQATPATSAVNTC